MDIELIGRAQLALCCMLVPVILGQNAQYPRYDQATGQDICSPRLICLNHGRCQNNTCLCPPGYTGDSCGTNITCPALSVLVSNALFPPGYTAVYNSMVTYGCRPGHQFLGVHDVSAVYEKMVRCSQYGTWQPKPQDCIGLCPPIPTWRGYTVSTTQRYSGTSVVYNCTGYFPEWTPDKSNWKKPQYKFADGGSGPRMAICSDEGDWMPRLAECLDLGHLPPTYGTSHGDHNVITFSSFSSFILYISLLINFSFLEMHVQCHF